MEGHIHKSNKHNAKPWQISTIVLAILLVLSFLIDGSDKTSSLTKQEAADKAITYINQNLLRGQGTARLEGIEEDSNLYNIKLNVNGQNMDSYITKDGKLLFPQAFNLAQEPTQQTPKQQELEKSDKPIVELFVMSHCPYGTQIEKGIIPVVELLGDKIDFQLKFVNYAMHGKKEIDEQLNQYCIQKEYPPKLIVYLKCFLEQGDGEGCIIKSGFDASKIASCVEKADEQFRITLDYNDKSKWMGNFPPFNIYREEIKKYGVRGSPGLRINGNDPQTNRDAQSLLNAVCSAFSNKPEECNVDLTSNGNPSPGFGYKTTAVSTSRGGCG